MYKNQAPGAPGTGLKWAPKGKVGVSGFSKFRILADFLKPFKIIVKVKKYLIIKYWVP